MTVRRVLTGPALVVAAVVVAIATVTAPADVSTAAESKARATLLVTSSTGRHALFVEDEGGVVDRVDVGAAPHGVALAPNDRAYVASARGVAVVDTRARRRIAFVRYRAPVGPASTGEYRPGGMGIAASPDGRFAYVGVHLDSGPGRLEVVDIRARRIVGSVAVGVRPFDVLASRDGRFAYSVDHDSYSVTVVDTKTLRTRTIRAEPLGLGAFDKPHYAALDGSGRLLLPFQGRVLLRLDPRSGRSTRIPLTARTHQHGVALTSHGQLMIVGTGPAGDVDGPPSISIVDVRSGEERVVRFAASTSGSLWAATGASRT